MKPVRFAYHVPSSVDEAVALLRDLRDEDAKILAGGQSLMPLMNMRLVRPRHVVDINDLTELDYLRIGEDGGLAIGALTRQRALERSPEVAARVPLLAEAVPLIGDRQVRCRGAMGGSLAHADPAAEIPTVAAALDAQMVLRGPSGSRTVPAGQFFVTFLTTALEADELLVEVRFPPAPPGAGFAFIEFVRQLGAFAIVSVAAMVLLQDGKVADGRICLGGVGPTPVRAVRAEQALRGQEATAEVFREIGRLASDETDPTGDIHGSAEYRREMAAVYTRRALQAAAARAQAPGSQRS